MHQNWEHRRSRRAIVRRDKNRKVKRK